MEPNFTATWSGISPSSLPLLHSHPGPPSRRREIGRPVLSCQSCRLAQDFPGGSVCLPVWETPVRSLGREDPLEEGMAAHSSILAWRIPWIEEPGGLQSLWLQRVGHNLATKQEQ